MKLKDFFSNDFETKDKHSNELLKTHYYRVDYNKARSVLIETMKNLQLTLEEELQEYREFRFTSSRAEVIASIYSSSFFHQGIDFKVNTVYFIPRGRGLKLITKIYTALDSVLPRVE